MAIDTAGPPSPPAAAPTGERFGAYEPTPGLRLRLALFDRPSPSIWSALAGDPTLAVSSHVRNLLAVDQKRWSRRLLFPIARFVSLVIVTAIVWFKRIVPLALSWHGAIDWLSIRFIRRFVSPEGAELLVRHFILETNLLAFIAANSGHGVREPTLRPTSVEGLGNSAVIEHDVNVFALLMNLDNRPFNPPAVLDGSMLAVPELESPTRRRWMNIDIETALYLMNIPFAMFLTANEYKRAVHSLTLDENLLECLYQLTRIQYLRDLSPEGSSLLIRTIGNVPRRLYVHSVVHETAHEVLRREYAGQSIARTADRR